MSRHPLALAVARGAVAGAAVALAATAAGSALAAHFARRVVTPSRSRPDDATVLAVHGPAGSPTAVVLRESPEALAPGRYGLWLAGGAGHARLGPVLERDGGTGRGSGPATVTREVVGVDAGELVPGPARWDGAYFAGDPSSALGLAHADVLVRSDVGDLPTWEVPPPPAGGGGAPASDVWAVLVHGRGATRAECLRALPVLHRLGVGAVVPAYRNDAEAPPSRRGRYGLGGTEWRDVEAAVLHALARGAREVVLVGWSMGAATVLQLLARSWTADRVRAVVLDGPVLDWRHVLDHQARLNRLPAPIGRYGLAMLSSPVARAVVGVEDPVDLGRMDWVARAAELHVPLLVLHSDDDEYVPVEPTRWLAAARPDVVRHVEFTGAGHCREWNVDPDRWEREVARFLLDHL